MINQAFLSVLVGFFIGLMHSMLFIRRIMGISSYGRQQFHKKIVTSLVLPLFASYASIAGIFIVGISSYNISPELSLMSFVTTFLFVVCAYAKGFFS